MVTEITLAAHARELEQIVGSIFETMLLLEASLTQASLPEDEEMLTAGVYLTGNHQGVVFIHCAPPQACEFAGRFLDARPFLQVDDDVRDVMGELANMIAGNLKCTLLPGAHLSMPSVIECSMLGLRVAKGRPLERMAFDTPVGPFWVSMLLMQP